MIAPKIKGYTNETCKAFHREVLKALNWGDANGECKPIYSFVNAGIIAIRRDDGLPFDADQLADLDCQLRSIYTYDVTPTNEDKFVIATIKTDVTIAEDARGDRFLQTLARVQDELPTPVRCGLATRLADLISVPRVSADWLDDDTENNAAPAARFAVLTGGEFVKRPRLEQVIKGVLALAQIAFVIAQWGVGKTYLTIDMLTAVHLGLGSWFGHRIPKRRRCCYVPAEGAVGAQLRFEAIAKHRGISVDELPSVIPSTPNLTKEKDVNDLIASLQAAAQRTGEPWGVIALDTLAAMTSGADEQTGKDMGPVMDAGKRISDATGALVLFVAHMGKDEDKGLRGWSGMGGAGDGIIEVRRDGDLRTWSTGKVKDGPDDIKHSFRLVQVTLGRDEDGDPITSCIVEPVDSTTSKKGVTRKRPKNGTPLLVLQRMERDFQAATPTMDEVLEAMREQLESTVKNPARVREYFREAVAKLADVEVDRWLYRHGVERISLSPVAQATEKEFEA